jgi:hypothetical protein
MFRSSLSTLAIVVFSALLASTAVAADQTRVSEEFRQALLRLAQSGEFADVDDPLLIERPAERVANFGLLLDRDDVNGLRVLGTLPGGSAEQIGLRAGDRLLAANGVDLKGAGGTERMRSLLDGLDTREELSMQVERDGTARRLAGTVESFQLPAMRVQLLANADSGGGRPGAGQTAGDGSTCGRISVFGTPPRSRQLFNAVLLEVDGETAGPSGQTSFRVSPGRHTLKVAESIDNIELSSIANSQRAKSRGRTHKTFEIVVEPGITYDLAARLVPERRSSILDGRYWMPEIWQERSESCR